MSVTRPRGPLPARVYWTRRVLVLGVAFALVFGIGRLLGGFSGRAAEPAARPAAAESPTGSPTAVSTSEALTGDQRKGGTRRSQVRVPLAMPSGPCQDSDVRVVPALKNNPYAGGDVRLTLQLTTFSTPACNWEVSPETLAVKLSSGSDRIWSTQDCPNAVPHQPVVLRRDRRPVLVDVVWSGRRSDPDCSRVTEWAEPGYYHVAAAAMGSEPADQQFRLLPPAPVTITPTPKPKKSPKPEQSSKPEPTATPSSHDD